MSKTFHSDVADVTVTAMLQCLGDQPWFCEVHPLDGSAPASYIETEAYAFNAAADALDEYKEQRCLNPTTIWNL